MEIYLARKQVQAGPYSVADFNKMVDAQQIEPTDLMWHSGMADWQTVAKQIASNYPYNPAGADSHQHEADAGNTNPASAQADRKTGEATEKKANTEDWFAAPAPLNDRILAKIVDLVLLLLPIPLIIFNTLPPGGMAKVIALQSKGQAYINQNPQLVVDAFGATALSLALAYALIFIALQAYLLSTQGHSIGKKIFGLVVLPLSSPPLPNHTLTIADGSNFTQCFLLRSLLFIVLFVTPFYLVTMLAPLWALFDPTYRQSLADRLAKTIVVKRKTG